MRAIRPGLPRLLALALLAAPGVGEAVEAERPRAKFEPPNGRVLHGWGQHISLYEKEAAPYISAVGKDCAIISDYVDLLLIEGITQETIAYVKLAHPKLAEGRDDEQIRRIVQSFLTTPVQFADFRKRTGKPYVPLLGVFWHRSNDSNIAVGKHDQQIKLLANQVKQCGFPVFLRPGFEFGPYGYTERRGQTSREHYAKMFRRFVEVFRGERVKNAAFVWNTVGVEAYDYWMDYYPGDEYVDWWGINLFSRRQILGSGRFLAEASKHGKPVMICESAPAFERGTGDDGSVEKFFAPYFALIEQHSHIKAFVYINIDWAAQEGSPFAHWPDSRVQSNPKVVDFYRRTLAHGRFMHLGSLTRPDPHRDAERP